WWRWQNAWCLLEAVLLARVLRFAALRTRGGGCRSRHTCWRPSTWAAQKDSGLEEPAIRFEGDRRKRSVKNPAEAAAAARDVVQAEANDVKAVVVRYCQRAGDRAVGEISDAGGLAAQIGVQIFALDGPTREKHPLDAAASGPAGFGGSVLVVEVRGRASG